MIPSAMTGDGAAGASNGPAGDPTAGAAFGTGHPKIRIRTFTGDPSEYREWRREVETSAFLFSVPEKQLAGLVYLALSPEVA